MTDSSNKKKSLMLRIAAILIAILVTGAGVLTGMVMRTPRAVIVYENSEIEPPAPDAPETASPPVDTAKNTARKDAANPPSTPKANAGNDAASAGKQTEPKPETESEKTTVVESVKKPAFKKPASLQKSNQAGATDSSTDVVAASPPVKNDKPLTAKPPKNTTAAKSRRDAKRFSVVVGSYVTRSMAEKLVGDLTASGFKPEILKITDKDDNSRFWYEVQIGDAGQMKKAYDLAHKFEKTSEEIAVIRPVSANLLQSQKKAASSEAGN